MTKYQQLTNKFQWKRCTLLLILFTLFAGFGTFYKYQHTPYVQIVAPLNFRRNYDNPKILQYTTFFGSYDSNMIQPYKTNFTQICKVKCTITDDKREVTSADAVLFHLKDMLWHGSQYIRNDTGVMFSFPRYRHPGQLWVLYNQEPVSLLWGSMGSFQGRFNWTVSYRRDSDVVAPYGQPKEVAKSMQDGGDNGISDKAVNDVFVEKSEDGAIAVISNCKDDARRYKLIEAIKKFIPVKIYGKCGEGRLESDKNDIQKRYKFYLAFENSDCVDYVTEKYWTALASDQIPIVAWKNNMNDIVIPSSYINIYDFADMTIAGAFIKSVNDDRRLYNTYFNWKKKYQFVFPRALCRLCEKLHLKGIPRKTYDDFKGWINKDTCKPLTVWRLANRAWDRFLFDIGL